MKLAKVILGYINLGYVNLGYNVASSHARTSADRTSADRKPAGQSPVGTERALRTFRNRFRCVRRLGEGSQGVVHLCRDLHAHHDYVVTKIAHRNAKSREAVEREALCLWGLRDSHAVPRLQCLLYRRGRLRGFATDFTHGLTLDVIIRRNRVFPEGGQKRLRATLSLACSLTDAVLDVLSRGYLHRDLKPKNLLISPRNDVKILDFGLGCRRGSTPLDGEVSGTLAYASPEQLAARILDEKSDLFSLGLILYELATGTSLFGVEHSDFQSFLKTRETRLGKSIDLEGAPPSISSLIRRLLEVDPAERAGTGETGRHLQRMRDALWTLSENAALA